MGGGLSIRPGATAALRGGREQYPSETVTEDIGGTYEVGEPENVVSQKLNTPKSGEEECNHFEYC